MSLKKYDIVVYTVPESSCDRLRDGRFSYVTPFNLEKEVYRGEVGYIFDGDSDRDATFNVIWDSPSVYLKSAFWSVDDCNFKKVGERKVVLDE